ncbi:ABC transporter permease [Streptomyces chrestomyceticus]|uniref:ABC transporter permease n=2 Tax=Streptomyces chrestomyceticus TaxID=68185 RepID=UPI00067B18D4
MMTEKVTEGTAGSEGTAGNAAARVPDRCGTARFDLAVMRGYWLLEAQLLRRVWGPVMATAVVQPLVYLLAFNAGFGGVAASAVPGNYLDFLATGMVGVAVLFGTTYAVMHRMFVRREIQRTFDAILTAPIEIREIVAAQALWTGVVGGTLGAFPILVAIPFGLHPTPGMLLVVPLGILSGIGLTLFGLLISLVVRAIDSINYIVAAVLTPAFLVAGTFFPLDALPGWAHRLALVNPLYHCVELVRHVSFGIQPSADLLHLCFLVAFSVVLYVLTVFGMHKRLID